MKLRILSSLILFCLCLAGCREEILHDLDEPRANRAQLALERASLRAEKVRSASGWNIRVDSSDIVRALAVLEKSRLLWRDLSRFKANSAGLIQSREQRAQALERETAWTLEQTLERIPGVLEARVQLYVLPKDDFELRKGGERSGSVLLLAEKSGAVDAAQIKQLISGATGIPAQSVSVVVSADDAALEKTGPSRAVDAPVRAVSLGGFEVRCLAAAAALLILLIYRISARGMRRKQLRASVFSPVQPEPSPLINGSGAYHHSEVF